MSGEVKDECGVAAVFLPDNKKKHPFGGASFYLYKMLVQMQNRGQLSAGITTYNSQRDQLINTFKKRGAVSEVFATKIRPKARAIMNKYSGTAGIGHVRYTTSGGDDAGAAQPFERHHGRKWKWFSFAFNGNLANFVDLKKQLEEKQYHLVRNLDTEIILHFLEKGQIGDRKKSKEEVFKNASQKFDGAYNIVYIDAEGTLVAMRDPHGIRPMCYAITDDFVGAASESVALTKFVDNGIKDLKPGEMLLVKDGKPEIKQYTEPKKTAHCMFEYVYFANASSIIDGRSVYQTRWRLGVELAKQESMKIEGDDWVVVAVPDTAKPAADAYAHTLGIPAMEGLIRNRYVGRTFIEGSDRAERIKEKFNVNIPILKGKKVILVDDSIVRGSTSESIVEYIMKKGKPKELHMRVSCPPIRSPCFYGIDMSTMGELIANRHSTKAEMHKKGYEDLSQDVVDKIAKEIGVKTLRYMTLDGLVKSIGLPNGKQDLCMACLTGEYPTPYGEKLRVKALDRFERGLEATRTYE